MKKTEQFLTVGDEKLHILCMEPEGEIRAVLQIVHGMQEYVGRYEDFASFLCGHQIAVVGHDHLGHGLTSPKEDRGYFGDEGGMEKVLSYMEQTTRWAEERFPENPLFLMGHSMGSLFSRYYLTYAGAHFSGAIIMGTAYQEWPAVWAGKLLSGFLRKVKGPRYVSPLLCQLVNGNMNRKFEGQGKNAWLSKDLLSVEKYNQDELCQFPFTCGAYYEMFRLLGLLKKKEGMERIPKELPILVTSGKEDPVGNFGHGVKKAYRDFSSVCLDCTLKLYETGRHELINEVEKQEVYEDLLKWIEARY